MTRRDWWIGVTVIVGALLFHAAVPRYEWRQTGAQFIRIDRWTGRAEAGNFSTDGWQSLAARAGYKADYQRRVDEWNASHPAIGADVSDRFAAPNVPQPSSQVPPPSPK